jgi:exosortase E/protease (VPEID-CTERM system)
VSTNLSSIEHAGDTVPVVAHLGLTDRTRSGMPAAQYIALLFLLEMLLFTFFRVNQTAGAPVNGFAIVDTEGKAELLRAVSAGVLTFIAGLLVTARRREMLSGMFKRPMSIPLLVLHMFAVVGSATIPALYFSAVPSTPPMVISSMRFLGMALAACFGFLSLFSARGLIGTLWRVGPVVWISSLFVAVVINPLTQGIWSLSSDLATLTLHFVDALLRPLLPDLSAQQDGLIIGTDRFSVRIAPGCSGLEGIVLIFLLSALGLAISRDSYRFPRALLILPIGMAAVWIMNSLRIAALILIGERASPAVAVNGFHSQAGWIAFATVAFLMWFALQRMTWFAASPGRQPVAVETALLHFDSTAAYVVPMLVLLITSGIARGLSDQFEWLYPIEVLGTALALWHYRAEYRSFSQAWNWAAAATGVGIFAVWLALVVFYAPAQRTTDAAIMSQLSSIARVAWIGFRFLGKGFIEPAAQTLVLFGFLARRFQSSDFKIVSFSSLHLSSILVCAALAAATHSDTWAAALIGALITGLFLRRTGKLGSAIAANAVAGTLMAVVLAAGK